MPLVQPSLSPDDVARFSRLSQEWWQPEGAFRVLHALTPARLDYGRARLQGFDQPQILDVGCGGGIFAEALAKEGYAVTGLDASAEAIKAARQHAEKSGLSIDYKVGTVETSALSGRHFDAVVAFEILEHVRDASSFLDGLTKHVAKDGLLMMSSLNRTLESLVLGVWMAEYALGWIPSGTHDWQRFKKPSELAEALERRDFEIEDITGLVYDMGKKTFSLQKGQVKMNYFLTARRK